MNPEDRKALEAAREALGNLLALIVGECPSLFEEDSGGSSHLHFAAIDALTLIDERLQADEPEENPAQAILKRAIKLLDGWYAEICERSAYDGQCTECDADMDGNHEPECILMRIEAIRNAAAAIDGAPMEAERMPQEER